MIRLVVYGRPAPQGSKRSFGKGRMVEMSPHVGNWREDVRVAALQAIAALPIRREINASQPKRGVEVGEIGFFPLPLDYPLRVSMTFTVAKPASAPKKRTTYPDRMPDLSKLIRATEDAITSSGLWKDDARVVELTAAKRYPNEGPDALDRPGCVITIEVIS